MDELYNLLTSICGLPKAVTLIAAKPSSDAAPRCDNHKNKYYPNTTELAYANLNLNL